MLTSVVGINWGDEGKGRMVDLLSQDYDIVVRYQGGNNAGHTVVNDRGRFILNLLPSGILRDETVNVLGPGMVIDMEHLYNEVQRLRDAGIEITPKHLKISDRASICMPYHKLLDCLEEDRLGDKKFGSTRRGISPAYSDRYMKKALRVGELLHRELLDERVIDRPFTAFFFGQNKSVFFVCKHSRKIQSQIHGVLCYFFCGSFNVVP